MKGKLKLAANKKSWLLEREGASDLQVSAKAVSRNLFPLNAEKHDGLEVEFELELGQVAKVFEAEGQWQAPSPAMPDRRPQGHQSGAQRTAKHASALAQPQKPIGPLVFHNPYNFVPAPPRVNDGELGDHEPAGHDRYQPDRWSGRIAVRLTTETPLLIVDGGQSEPYEKDPDHRIYPVRLVNGQPYLPPTSIKGMLRSAYEAVTNSRLAVFEKHNDRLAYRMAAKIGPVPARVDVEDGHEVLRIMKASVMGYAAKLPRYQKDGREKDKGESKTHVALRYPDGTLPQHGDRVWVQLDKARVARIQPRNSEHSPGNGWRPGWACVTGPNIDGKIYERVFLEDKQRKPIKIKEQHRSLWRELIENYRETHKRDIEKRDAKGERPQDYLGDEPGKTGWSRHIYKDGERELHPGTLCYVEFAPNSDEEIVALIPVTISRRLYSAGPNDLLPDSLKPATRIEDLSPAERVFGWVRQSRSATNNAPSAYRGNLRIGPIKCISAEPVEQFEHPGVPLAILGQPKPQQARFYVASSKNGEAQPNGITKEDAGYFPHKGLRGRKVYPHHLGLPTTYWKDPFVDRTQRRDNGFFQEYRRPLNEDVERDDQNRSITSWVRPQVLFQFEIEITNLSSVELGALLWLLDLPSNHFHSLGGGKPLGFGSVHLDIEWRSTELHKGDWWSESYKALDYTETLNQNSEQNGTELQDCITRFKQAIGNAYGGGDFERASFIAAFTRSAAGFEDGKPLHYPRASKTRQRHEGTIAPNPQGESFKWFAANERTAKQDGGPKLSLPDLETDQGLPILDDRPS
jgi:CRISPR-associated protein (TIGR03986 family)